MTVVVHALNMGRALCNFSRKVPDQWPEGHRWVPADRIELVTCQDCLDVIRLHRPSKNHIPRIEALWAFLSVDPKDGNEGVIAAPLQIGMVSLPLIGSDEQRVKSLLPIARQIAKHQGIRVRLVKFTTREEIEVIE